MSIRDGGTRDASFAHLLHANGKCHNNRRLITLHSWIFILLITSAANGFGTSMMNGLQSLPQWMSAFDNPSNKTLGVLNAIQSLGALAGYPFCPYLSDGIGRRKTVFLGAVIMLCASVLQTAAVSLGMFISARFLIGFGLSFAANAAPVLITELSFPEYRAPLTALYSSLWCFGSLLISWSTYASFGFQSSWAWRLPSLLQGMAPLVQVAFVLFVPESPRWLVSQGRDDEALQILAYYHADGDERDPLVQYEFKEIKTAIEFDRTVSSNVGWRTLIATPGNRKRMRIIIALGAFPEWSGNGLVSYYFAKVLNRIGIVDPTTQLLINGILQFWNLFWAVLAAFLVNKLGRRFLFLCSTMMMFFFYALQSICIAEYSVRGIRVAGNIFVVLVFLFCAAFNIAFTPLPVTYTVEILPFNIRAKGLIIFNFAASFALILNQYINPIALGYLGWKLYVIYVFWLAFEFLFLWAFLLETKNRTLEETSAIFDGEDVVEQIVHEFYEPIPSVE